ncbi:MFS_MdtG_SLC18_like domain containing protein [Rhabdaerophilaceae bacterium]
MTIESETSVGGNLATARQQRGFAYRLLASVIVLLLLAQGLAGALATSALSRLVTDLTQTKIEVVAGATLAKIETAIRFGKSLGQFIGLRDTLSEFVPNLPEVDQIQVYLVNGQPINLVEAGAPKPSDPNLDPWSNGRLLPPGTVLALADGVSKDRSVQLAKRNSGAVSIVAPDGRRLAIPIRAGANVTGWAVFGLNEAVQAKAVGPLTRQMLVSLLIFTATASLLVAFGLWLCLKRWQLDQIPRAVILALPLCAVIIGQGIFTANMVSALRSAYVESTKATVASLGSGLQRDIDRLLQRGIDIGALTRIEEPLSRLVKAAPQLSGIAIQRPDGSALYKAGQIDPFRLLPGGELLVELPLGATASQSARGRLIMEIDAENLSRELLRRMVDSATVAVVSAVIVAEMFFLALLALPARQPAGSNQARLVKNNRSAAVAPTIGRALIALFLFAWALPLSFLTLHARTMQASMLAVDINLHMALPISAEMLCALITALLAGRFADRHGWQAPVLLGLAISLAGGIFALWVQTLEGFILARALVGAGYGFTWIGIQSMVVEASDTSNRAENLAKLVAGIYAGHLSGSAVGAMLADQFSFDLVFQISVALLLVPLVWLLVSSRRSGSLNALGYAAPATTPDGTAPLADAANRPGNWLGKLVFSRDFGALLLGAVVPFSIVQVGLLYFALPIQLSGQGVTGSDIGRVLMLYGLTTIFLGPSVARLVDRSTNKKAFIPMAGLAGGGGLLLVLFEKSAVGLLIAVAMLAIAGAMTQAAQASYALGLDKVRNAGLGFSFGLQRAADKFGQMLGPLVVGGLVATLGGTGGLAALGISYAALTLMFFLVAPASRRPGSLR